MHINRLIQLMKNIRFSSILIVFSLLIFPMYITADTAAMDRMNQILLTQTGSPQDTIEGLKKIIYEYPDFIYAYEKLEILYLQTRQIDGGMSFFTELLADEQYIHAGYELGRLLLQTKKLDQAYAYFKQQIENYPSWFHSYSIIPALFLYAAPDEKEAWKTEIETYLLELAEKEKHTYQASIGLGMYYYRNYDWEKSEKWLLQALTGLPEESYINQILAVVYSIEGKYDKALEQFLIRYNYALESHNKESLMKSALNVGSLYMDTGNFAKALEYHTKSLELALEFNDPVVEATSYGNIAQDHMNMGNYDAAELSITKAIEMQKRLGNKRALGIDQNTLGIIYKMRGEYLSAIDAFNQGLTTSKETENTLEVGHTLGNLSEIYLLIGNISRAKDLCSQGLKVTESVKNPVLELKLNLLMANIYQELKYYSAAEEYFNKSIEVAVKANNKTGQGSSYSNLAILYYKQGFYQKALEYLNKGLAIQEEVAGTQQEGFTYLYLSKIWFQLGDYEKAIQYANLCNAYSLANPQLLQAGHLVLGNSYSAMGDYEQGLTEYNRSIKYIESMRGKFQVDEYKTLFFSNKVSVFADTVELLTRMDTPGTAEKAFEYAERAKAKSLLDALSISSIDILPNQQQALAEKQHSLDANYTQTFIKLQKLLSQPHSTRPNEEIEILQKNLAALDQEFEKLEVETAKNNPPYSSLVYPKPRSIEDTQNLLDEDTILLEYMAGENTLFIWKISKDTFSFHTLPVSREILARDITKLKGCIQSLLDVKHYGKTAYKIYQTILEPVLQVEDEDKNILIVPDGPLTQLPFEILLTEQPQSGDTFISLPYLIQKNSVSYIQSAAVLATIFENNSENSYSKELFAMGNPVFNASILPNQNQGLRDTYQGRAFSKLKPIPYSEPEVLEISKYFTQKDIFLKEEAREDILKEYISEGNYQYIHIAAHGLVNMDKPEYSGIILTQDEDPKEDGFLQTREIFNLNITSELVVLSACQTGAGRNMAGEGLLGLSRAFFYAGAKALAASLWNVDDKATKEIMILFYRFLSEGYPKNRALQLAKQTLIKNFPEKYSNPFFWGAFIITGDWQ